MKGAILNDKVRAYALAYVVLLALLGLTLVLAIIPLGPFNTILALVIAAAKAVLIAAVFMHLREEAGLTRLFSLAGVSSLLILATLALADYLSRGWLLLPGRWR